MTFIIYTGEARVRQGFQKNPPFRQGDSEAVRQRHAEA